MLGTEALAKPGVFNQARRLVIGADATHEARATLFQQARAQGPRLAGVAGRPCGWSHSVCSGGRGRCSGRQRRGLCRRKARVFSRRVSRTACLATPFFEIRTAEAVLLTHGVAETRRAVAFWQGNPFVAVSFAGGFSDGSGCRFGRRCSSEHDIVWIHIRTAPHAIVLLTAGEDALLFQGPVVASWLNVVTRAPKLVSTCGRCPHVCLVKPAAGSFGYIDHQFRCSANPSADRCARFVRVDEIRGLDATAGDLRMTTNQRIAPLYRPGKVCAGCGRPHNTRCFRNSA